jgi:cysteinyl-tRNA synthetase
MIHSNVLELVGNTPIVSLGRIKAPGSVKLLAKVESKNIGGSIKDRVALAMIEAAEAAGELTSDKTVIEATSGNTGIGLAMVCAVKGYKLTLVMPDSASEERKRIMRAYGAELLLTPGHLATDGAIEEAYRLAREQPETYLLMDQYNNPASVAAHFRTTGREIWEQTEGRVTHVVCTLGTSGTAMGIARYMKEAAPHVAVVAVEPCAGHKIQGLKNMQESYPPGIYDKHAVDRVIRVDDAEAFACARRLAREEGLLVGMSSGAALAGALLLAGELEAGTIVFICPDSGERYLSTTLFAPPAEHGVSVVSVATDAPVILPAEPTPLGLFTPGPSLDDLDSPEAWRRIVLLDLLQRRLAAHGVAATACVGLPDFDDRALSAARAAKASPAAFAATCRQRLAHLAAALGVSPEVCFAPAQDSLPRALDLTRKLLARGLAYERLRSVYFDVTRDKSYGQTAHADLDGLALGHTVDLADYVKEHPADFTLLKRASLQDLKLGEVLETEWGKVRPSWFLQLAAAALQSLGRVSVVLAGEAQRFPHLENFAAIWASAGVRPKAWLVAQPVFAREPGSPPPGLSTLLTEAGNGRVVRLWLLSTHYRRPLAAGPDSLAMWAANQKKLQDLYATLRLAAGTSGTVGPEMAQAVAALASGANAALDDDLGLNHLWPALFGFAKQVNAQLTKGSLTPVEAAAAATAFDGLDRILGLIEPAALPLAPGDWPAPAADLVARRESARRAKDFTAADSLRQDLAALGLRVEDHPSGPRLYRG